MKRALSMLVMLVVLVFTMMVPAFAAISITSLDDLDGQATGSQLTDTQKCAKFLYTNIQASWVRTYLTTDQSNGDPSMGSFTAVDGKQYWLVNGADIGKFANRLDQAYKSAKVTDDTVNITNGLDISANTSQATDMLSGVIPIVNIFLGLVVVLITAGLAVFTACDVMYITMPVFRNKCEDAKAAGTGPAVTKTANGGTKLRFVTDEAIYAVNNCGLDTGKNPLTVYLGKRVLAYIIVSILLFILLTGNISIITNIAVKVVSGLMNVLQGLAS